MSKDNTGGPAFPNPALANEGWCGFDGCEGMTLHDYAVIRYTAAMLAHATRYKPRPEDAHLHWHDAITKEAGELTDAMLRAREGGDA